MKDLSVYQTIQACNDITLWYKSFENIVGKGVNAGYQHFHLFPQCFPPHNVFYFINIKGTGKNNTHTDKTHYIQCKWALPEQLYPFSNPDKTEFVVSS